MTTQSIISPQKAADDLREIVWRDKNSFPIDPVAIAHKLGIRVMESSLPENVSGAIIKEKGKDPVIIVSRYDSDNRKRFSVAHELGHYVYRLLHDEDSDEFEWVDLRNEESASGNKEEEIFSNQFAANLLMPSAAVNEAAKKFKNILLLSLHFGVSNESMKIRLNNLGLQL